MSNNTASPYYPYNKVQEYAYLPDAEKLLKQIMDYLLDMPLKGYDPPDNNEYPRCRISKLLYWDCEDPFGKPIPTPEQKLSIVFDPRKADNPPDRDRMYRVFPMVFTAPQAEYVGKTSMKIFMGSAKGTSPFRIDQTVVFEVLSNSAYESNAGGMVKSRSYDICCDIMRALNGVNIAGVGTFYFDRRQNPECKLEPIWDKSFNVGYDLIMGVSFVGGEDSLSDDCR